MENGGSEERRTPIPPWGKYEKSSLTCLCVKKFTRNFLLFDSMGFDEFRGFWGTGLEVCDGEIAVRNLPVFFFFYLTAH
jgi:hypothetical protein